MPPEFEFVYILSISPALEARNAYKLTLFALSGKFRVYHIIIVNFQRFRLYNREATDGKGI